jgi:hypothetical protein
VAEGRNADVDAKLPRLTNHLDAVERLQTALAATLADAQRKLESSAASLYMIGQGRGVKMEGLEKTMNRLHDGTLRRLKIEVDGRHHVPARESYRAVGAR